MATKTSRAGLLAGLLAAVSTAALAQAGHTENRPARLSDHHGSGRAGLLGKFPVDSDGMIAYPFLGRLKAAGFGLRARSGSPHAARGRLGPQPAGARRIRAHREQTGVHHRRGGRQASSSSRASCASSMRSSRPA